MMERWNPLKGHVGIISAFNFPNAVFFWNVRRFGGGALSRMAVTGRMLLAVYPSPDQSPPPHTRSSQRPHPTHTPALPPPDSWR